jgi:hypothetical protein
MKRVLFITLIALFAAAVASAQSNKIVFGPLEGDDAGVLTVHNGEDIEIEIWVRTDPSNPNLIEGMCIGLMSADSIIADRNCAVLNPENNWDYFWCDGPFYHDGEDNFPIPQGHTAETIVVICWHDLPYLCFSNQGEWDYFGSFLMTCNTGVVENITYWSLSEGWYPHSGQGTSWSFYTPPGGSITPEQDFCSLYFEAYPCLYIPGDCDHNGTPLELNDVLAMIDFYRGEMEPNYRCGCGEDPIIHGFAPTADPDGNCIPNELNDVVTEIGAYRGTISASGCPDCPGSE